MRLLLASSIPMWHARLGRPCAGTAPTWLRLPSNYGRDRTWAGGHPSAQGTHWAQMAMAVVWRAMVPVMACKASVWALIPSRATWTRVSVFLPWVYNARTLDRLTKYVTTPRDDASQTVKVLYATIRELPDIVLKLRPPTFQSNEEGLRQGLMNALSLCGTMPGPQIYGLHLACHPRIASIPRMRSTALCKAS
jgi:hypothetical protein